MAHLLSGYSRVALLATIFLSICPGLKAGGEGSLDFVRAFLQQYPVFKAEGIMTSTLPGRDPYRCRIEIAFDKATGMTFWFNTDSAKNIIPYDYAFENKRLTETIYNRTRSETVSVKDIGAPTRTLFNFVWDVIKEAEDGAGLNSLVFNGLMTVDEMHDSRRTQITLGRRFPVIPVKSVVFTFDNEKRLKSLQIEQTDGSEHRIEIKKFRSPRPVSKND